MKISNNRNKRNNLSNTNLMENLSIIGLNHITNSYNNNNITNNVKIIKLRNKSKNYNQDYKEISSRNNSKKMFYDLKNLNYKKLNLNNFNYSFLENNKDFNNFIHKTKKKNYNRCNSLLKIDNKKVFLMKSGSSKFLDTIKNFNFNNNNNNNLKNSRNNIKIKHLKKSNSILNYDENYIKNKENFNRIKLKNKLL
jgi:hypothetical protein